MAKKSLIVIVSVARYKQKLKERKSWCWIKVWKRVYIHEIGHVPWAMAVSNPYHIRSDFMILVLGLWFKASIFYL
jgi:hypothetical protein